MGPISLAKRRVEQNRALMQLDDAEMALSLMDCSESMAGSEVRHRAAKPGMSYDVLLEYASAASLILERDEYMALARELEQALHSHPIAA